MTSTIHDDHTQALAERKFVTFYSYKGGVGRTMALVNVAYLLARRPKAPRVLCVDLDFEAPSISSHFPPAAQPEQKNLGAGLFEVLELLCQSEPIGLEERVHEFLGETIYRSAVNPSICVLPSGGRDLKNRHEILHRLATQLWDEARCKRLIETLKGALSHDFEYVLLDVRTGLSDPEFTLTTKLSETLVLFFRPDVAHLVGAQAMLQAFARQCALDPSSPALPVIPVMSPRMHYSTLQIVATRQAARTAVFKWLSSPPGRDVPFERASNTLIELSYDAAAENGERLFSAAVVTGPAGPTEREGGSSHVQPIDPEAPLHRAYETLRQQIQQLNAGADEEGARLLEQALYDAYSRENALSCLLSSLGKTLGNDDLWEDVELGYGDLVVNDARAQSLLRRFCSLVLKNVGKTDGDKPRSYANYWLARLTHRQSAKVTYLRHAWRLAFQSQNQSLIRKIAELLCKLYEDSEDHSSLSSRLPSWVDAAELNAYFSFHGNYDVEAAVDALIQLELVYSRDPVYQDEWTKILQGQFKTSDERKRATAFCNWAEHLILLGRPEEAGSVLDDAIQIPTCPTRVWMCWAQLSARLKTPEHFQQVWKRIRPERRAYVRHLPTLRGTRTAVDWNELDEEVLLVELDDTQLSEVYAATLLHAWEGCPPRQLAMIARNSTWALLDLWWENRPPPNTPMVCAQALARLQIDPHLKYPFESEDVLLAAAFNPAALVDLARTRVAYLNDHGSWPTSLTSWGVLQARAGESEIWKGVSPTVAQYLTRHAFVFLLIKILSRHSSVEEAAAIATSLQQLIHRAQPSNFRRFPKPAEFNLEEWRQGLASRLTFQPWLPARSKVLLTTQ